MSTFSPNLINTLTQFFWRKGTTITADVLEDGTVTAAKLAEKYATTGELGTTSLSLSNHVLASNPHGINVSKLGLGLVDNIPDTEKEVSVPQALALSGKKDLETLSEDTVDLDYATMDAATKETGTGAATVTIDNILPGKRVFFRLTSTVGAVVVTWPASITWATGLAPADPTPTAPLTVDFLGLTPTTVLGVVLEG